MGQRKTDEDAAGNKIVSSSIECVHWYSEELRQTVRVVNGRIRACPRNNMPFVATFAGTFVCLDRVRNGKRQTRERSNVAGDPVAVFDFPAR
jgi:hypothetical protein